MFRQDINNADIIDKQWFCYCRSRKELTDPEKVNNFLYSLMNPFPEVPVCDYDEPVDNNVKDINLDIYSETKHFKQKSIERKKRKTQICLIC